MKGDPLNILQKHRIDYFITSKRVLDNVKDIKIHSDILGSDHCPVELILK